jgi:tetratricopeptide (TPR) repeat protein
MRRAIFRALRQPSPRWTRRRSVSGSLATGGRSVRGGSSTWPSATGEVRGTLGGSPEALTQLARVYFLANQIDAARTKLEQVLDDNPRSAVALNNLGALDVASGEIEKAAGRFEAALASDPGDAGIWLNLGVARYAMGDTKGALDPLGQGLARSKGYEGACHLLGLHPTGTPARGDLETLTAEETRLLLLKALSEIEAIAAEGDTTRTPQVAGEPAAAKPMQTRVAASRAAERMTFKDHLYWKEWPGR